MKNKLRILSALAVVAVLVVMLSSVLYIAVEADHDCTGENCPICYQISICQDTLKQFGSGVAATAIAVALTYILVWSILPVQNAHTLTTLITLKVKLSD